MVLEAERSSLLIWCPLDMREQPELYIQEQLDVFFTLGREQGQFIRFQVAGSCWRSGDAGSGKDANSDYSSAVSYNDEPRI